MSCLGPEERRPELGCSDCYFRTQNNVKKCGSRGNPESKFVIIGESPGSNEIIDGVPFIGPSGDLLEQVLDAAGIQPNETPYVLNAIKCYPRGIKSAETLSVAAMRCHSHLVEELRAHPRDVILTLGNAALWTLTGDYGAKVTRERGRVFNSPLASVGIVCSVHPAFLLYGGGNLKQFKSDIALALKLLREGRPLRIEDVRYGILRRPGQVRQLAKLLNGLSPEDSIISDVETTGFSHLTDSLISDAFMFRDYVYVLPSDIAIPELFTSRARYVWSNGKFDVKFEHVKGFPARCDEDIMLANYTRNEKRGIHDLDQMGIDHLKMDPHKEMMAPYKAEAKRLGVSPQAVAPFPVVAKYQAIDVAKTQRIYHILRPQVASNKHSSKLYTDLIMPASTFLTRVEERGMTVDVEWTRKNSEYLDKYCADLEQGVNVVAQKYQGHEINIRSPLQLKALLYGTLKIGHPSKSTDEDTLREILRDLPLAAITYGGGDLLADILLYRTAHKQWRTYTYRVIYNVLDKKDRIVKLMYMQPDGKVHATYLIHGTATGRLASRGPNMQNQPRDPMIRGQFIASSGYVFIEPDLSQAELRSLACLSGDPTLLAIFNSSDRSLHDEVATQLFGKDFSGEEKMIAKNVNFGIVYGITAIGLYLQLVSEGVDGYEVSDCQAWLDGWGKQFPVAWAFINKCRDAVINQQNIVTMFGRVKRHGVVSQERLKKMQDEAANFPHQSIASDIVLKSSINIDDEMQTKYGARTVNLVHDSNLTEVPDDEATVREAAQRIMREFVELPRRMGLTQAQFKSDCKIGLRWGEKKNVRTRDVKMKSGKVLRAHPEWVQEANDFMRGWDPINDAYPDFRRLRQAA